MEKNKKVFIFLGIITIIVAIAIIIIINLTKDNNRLITIIKWFLMLELKVMSIFLKTME